MRIAGKLGAHFKPLLFYKYRQHTTSVKFSGFLEHYCNASEGLPLNKLGLVVETVVHRYYLLKTDCKTGVFL